MCGTHYKLVCTACGARYQDDGLRLDCDRPHGPALLRSEYRTRTLTPGGAPGIFRYRDWLPVSRIVGGAGRPAVYPSRRLGRLLGLDHLWICFSGYWPERGAVLPTGSFKDLEASALMGRLPDRAPVLVLASAGNTGAAAARACSQEGRDCLLVVPESALPNLLFAGETAACVRLVALREPADYADAIAFAERIARLPGFVAEGGTRNVARRDGLATAMFTAVEAIGRLPDHYVQAIGSGAGVIAAYEGAARVAAATGEPRPRMIACQNLPFAPVYDAWRARASRIPAGFAESPEALRSVKATEAGELTNRRPAYDVRGGLHDVLTGSAGDVLAVGNCAAREACELFRSVEGIDIELPAGVALAALHRAARDGLAPPDAVTLLHITGGGRAALLAEHASVTVEPRLRLARGDLASPDAVALVQELFGIAVRDLTRTECADNGRSALAAGERTVG